MPKYYKYKIIPICAKNGIQVITVVSCPPAIPAVLKNAPTNLFDLKHF